MKLFYLTKYKQEAWWGVGCGGWQVGGVRTNGVSLHIAWAKKEKVPNTPLPWKGNRICAVCRQNSKVLEGQEMNCVVREH